ncbi:hypothetical protein DERF_012075 [Dermatophagoides farinae]|uniref:Uncharacterized protein n=1 Tax=Dermatophagoides farinae TaxID=6954 RepID=A0A922KWR0_DERFA|nr:hypothetical protein DERF_012075 [Dermatophagoides farinae]
MSYVNKSFESSNVLSLRCTDGWTDIDMKICPKWIVMDDSNNNNNVTKVKKLYLVVNLIIYFV